MACNPYKIPIRCSNIPNIFEVILAAMWKYACRYAINWFSRINSIPMRYTAFLPTFAGDGVSVHTSNTMMTIWSPLRTWREFILLESYVQCSNKIVPRTVANGEAFFMSKQKQTAKETNFFLSVSIWSSSCLLLKSDKCLFEWLLFDAFGYSMNVRNARLKA